MRVQRLQLMHIRTARSLQSDPWCMERQIGLWCRFSDIRKWFFDNRNSIFWYQKLFSDIRNYFLISEIIFWYQKMPRFSDIRKWFSDIRKWFSDIRNSHIFWYQKVIFWYQKLIFWYQKISIKVLFGVPYYGDNFTIRLTICLYVLVSGYFILHLKSRVFRSWLQFS